MHRRGHVGMAMLAYAPVGFLLLQGRQIGLALLGLLGVLTVEPLPNSDFWVPGLRHGGTSHLILCALVVGGVMACSADGLDVAGARKPSTGLKLS